MNIYGVEYPACVNYQIYTNECSLVNIYFLSSLIALAVVLFLIHKYKITLRSESTDSSDSVSSKRNRGNGK